MQSRPISSLTSCAFLNKFYEDVYRPEDGANLRNKDQHGKVSTPSDLRAADSSGCFFVSRWLCKISPVEDDAIVSSPQLLTVDQNKDGSVLKISFSRSYYHLPRHFLSYFVCLLC